MFPTEYAMAPDEFARALEERGFESVWFPEHTHIPASRRSPWPGGGELPRDYWSSYDPFVALMAAGAATKRLKLGTGICLVIERDPITMAKEVATLDRLSNGRVLFGIGGGWNQEEMANHGTAWKSRWRLLRERVLAMKEIWTKKEAEFHGDFVNFDKIWADPKPVQKPHPPILIGGDGATTFDRVVEFGDGWMPIMRPHTIPVEKIPELRERLKKARPRPQDRAGLHLLRAAEEAGARRAPGLRRRARDLRCAVGGARGRAAAAGRVRRGDERLISAPRRPSARTASSSRSRRRDSP